MDKFFKSDFEANQNRIDLKLESLQDLYFNNKTRFDRVNHGDKNTLIVLSLVGLAILFISCFNYVNLSIAYSFRRAKEIGMRKVLGGSKLRVMIQFIGEALMLILLAGMLAVLLSITLLPALNSVFDLDVVLTLI